MLELNCEEHPSRHGIFVFHFKEQDKAAYFEDLLEQQDISFEKDIHENIHYYGIGKPDLIVAKKLNNLVIAKYRKRFISDDVLRYVTLTITIIAILIAILGYFVS